jgi:FAD:protein FMN transferase
LSIFTKLVFVLLLVGFGACSRSPAELNLVGPTMGTTYTVKIARPPAHIQAHEVRAVIDRELARIDESMSGYRPDSEISRFNASRSTDWREVSADLATVVQTALNVSEASGGAFDVTVTPLVQAWGFGAAANAAPADLPNAATLRRLSDQIGYRKLHVRHTPAALRKDQPELTVDLNGIAPGFAVDRIAAEFDALGLQSYMIDIGGEIRVRGRNAAGEKWRIAIEEPLDAEGRTPFAILELDKLAVATSGEYRHYYARDGKRYSHTIDPRSGRPIEHDLASVAVVHREAMYADAWGTAFNVLGAEAGYELALKLGMSVMFIMNADGQLQAKSTPTMQPLIASARERQGK